MCRQTLEITVVSLGAFPSVPVSLPIGEQLRGLLLGRSVLQSTAQCSSHW